MISDVSIWVPKFCYVCSAHVKEENGSLICPNCTTIPFLEWSDQHAPLPFDGIRQFWNRQRKIWTELNIQSLTTEEAVNWVRQHPNWKLDSDLAKLFDLAAY